MFSGFIFSGFYEYSDDDEDFFDESEKSTVDFYDETNDTEEDSGNGTLTRIKCSSSPEIPAKKRKSTSEIINDSTSISPGRQTNKIKRTSFELPVNRDNHRQRKLSKVFKDKNVETDVELSNNGKDKIFLSINGMDKIFFISNLF